MSCHQVGLLKTLIEKALFVKTDRRRQPRDITVQYYVNHQTKAPWSRSNCDTSKRYQFRKQRHRWQIRQALSSQLQTAQ